MGIDVLKNLVETHPNTEACVISQKTQEVYSASLIEAIDANRAAIVHYDMKIDHEEKNENERVGHSDNFGHAVKQGWLTTHVGIVVGYIKDNDNNLYFIIINSHSYYIEKADEL